jgi:3-phenylpropionate/trans-cinnamate dioxygenase ferredoxin reductase component
VADPYVIVGGGMAGAKTAEALRAEGYSGPIVLVGEEGELPYERPPLSKDYLRGESKRADAAVHPESWYSENDVELRTATRVTEIDLDEQRVSFGAGDGTRYEASV